MSVCAARFFFLPHKELQKHHLPVSDLVALNSSDSLISVALGRMALSKTTFPIPPFQSPPWNPMNLNSTRSAVFGAHKWFFGLRPIGTTTSVHWSLFIFVFDEWVLLPFWFPFQMVGWGVLYSIKFLLRFSLDEVCFCQLHICCGLELAIDAWLTGKGRTWPVSW